MKKKKRRRRRRKKCCTRPKSSWERSNSGGRYHGNGSTSHIVCRKHSPLEPLVKDRLLLRRRKFPSLTIPQPSHPIVSFSFTTLRSYSLFFFYSSYSLFSILSFVISFAKILSGLHHRSIVFCSRC